MDKNEFIKYIATSYDISKATASAAVDLFVSSLQEVIAAGESVAIDEIGEFQTRPLFPKEICQKHSNQGQLNKVLQSKVIDFTPSDKLKTLVSQNVDVF